MAPQVPKAFLQSLRRLGARATRHLLCVNAAAQRMDWFERRPMPAGTARLPSYGFRRRFVVSTSKFGLGQRRDSNRTPLRLHRVARKIGAGHPIGTVFKSRQPVGLTWQGRPDAAIVHRILWLEGLEEGFNRGGDVDTFQRYIYLHGFGDELTLGRPASHGCVHLAAADLLPLFDRLPEGTLVWLSER